MLRCDSILPHVVVLGGGFAGRAAVRALRGPLRRGLCRLTLVNREPFTVMTPALPDIASGRIEARYITETLERLLPPEAVRLTATVTSVDLDGRRVQTSDGTLDFDFLVLALGSVATPPSAGWSPDASYALASFDDAMRLRQDFLACLKRTHPPRIVISGAGYTGVELAVALALAIRRNEANACVTLLERGDMILPFLNERQRRRVQRALERHGVVLRLHCHVTRTDGRVTELSSGERLEGLFLCRTEGTHAPLRPEGKDIDFSHDGRLGVNPGLSLPAYPQVFAAGDAAALRQGDAILRKAVIFSIASGKRTGANIALALQGKPERPFRPIDLGWVIPLADDSVGRAFGKLPLDGLAGCLLHYAMCGLRNFNRRNLGFFALDAIQHIGKADP